jgi:hypothetical protein
MQVVLNILQTWISPAPENPYARWPSSRSLGGILPRWFPSFVRYRYGAPL